MDRKIPVYFDVQVMNSPITAISSTEPNTGRLKVAVFTKYANRNGSYITDAVAEQLITSATRGNTPVVGFFDPETQSWASHTGPTLANGYGYVEDFLGWETLTDTDGVARDYAIFSVVLFSEYFSEAQKIAGQHQSMELDPNSITGDWGEIQGEYYYIYKTASMLGFCIIGEHEPCFSVSSFFSKNDENYINQFDKFSSLLSSLKERVEEAENNAKGGEQAMDPTLENKEPEVVEEVVETPVEEEPAVEFENNEPAAEDEPVAEVEETPAEDEEPAAEPTEFEVLQAQFDTLQANYNELNSNYEAAQNRITELESAHAAEIESLNNSINDLKASLSNYQEQITAAENARKNALVEKYEKIIGEEEISEIKNKTNDFSYDELESKLAITFANKQLNSVEESPVVPLLEPEESQFALLMKKYRKN